VSQHQATHAHRHRPIATPLGPRSPEEPHRVATTLELFYDLVLVVAVAQAASGLHHALAENHLASGVVTFSMVFFGVWWSWVNFTWFASAYDNDDVVYRLFVLLQMLGALVFAAGIPRFEHGDLTVGVLGYVIMRLSLVTLWLRAARSDPERCRSAHRYAYGILAVQAAWVAALLVPTTGAAGVALFWALAACEMLIPAWAERLGRTPWHAEHIVERYGLFTLITLGESILAASIAVRAATEAGATTLALLPTVVGGLLIVFSFFWLYFDRPGHETLDTMKWAFLFGYGHYFVFASAAAVGAGLAVAVDHATQRAHVSDVVAGASVAVPAVLYLACLWVLHGRNDSSAHVVSPIVLVAILLAPFSGQGVLATGLVMGALTAYKIVRAAKAPSPLPH
jgi:low temperature requirement protein LtrA